MASLKNFNQYVTWLRRVYEEDPLLMMAMRVGFDIPGDNELIILSASPNELEQMLLEMNFSIMQSKTPVQTTEPEKTPWTREPIPISRRTYILKDGLTYAQVLCMNKPVTSSINQEGEEISFLDQGRRIGEMNIHTAMTFHPYNNSSEKNIPSDQYIAMKEFYKENAQKKFGEHTIQELVGHSHFTDRHRIFADEFVLIIKYLAKQDCQAVFQHSKSPHIIAFHNINLE